MLKISFKATKRPEEILSEAETFFVKQGLKPAKKLNNTIQFQGARGFVSLDVTHESEVTLETRDWESQVRKFAQRIKSPVT